jgi:hypothetical protein
VPRARTQHYAGPVRRDDDVSYHIEGLEGSSFLWSESDLASASIGINAWVDQEQNATTPGLPTRQIHPAGAVTASASLRLRKK